MTQVSFWKLPNNEKQEIPSVSVAKDGSTPDEWLGGIHPEAQLEVTSGFHLHADKFSRVICYQLHELQSETSVYEQLMKTTGMSRTQIQAFMQYAVHMLLLIPRTLEATPLAKLIDDQDPFFDRTGTLWVLHYIIASNPQMLVWNYMCNSILTTVADITIGEATEKFTDEL